jgi:CHAT domain-containing protein
MNNSRFLFRSHPHTSRCAWSLVFLLTAFGVVTMRDTNGAMSPQDADASTQEVRILAPGEVIEQRHLDAGKTHLYELTLAAQQYARIVVEQKGIDLVVKVEAPDQSLYRRIDNPNGVYGPEIISILAQVTSAYTIKVYSDNTLLAGDYKLLVEGPRAATSSDELRVTAERLFSEAQQLRSEAGASDEKLVSAIEKYNEARTRWSELGDLREQGYCLTNTARIYNKRSQLPFHPDHLRQEYLEQAFNIFDKALSVLLPAKDIPGQAFVLNETGATHRDFGDPLKAIISYERALQLRLDLGDRSGQAQIYNNLGLTNSNIGYQPKALEYYAKALPIWRELGAKPDEMNTLVNAGKANAEMGDLQTALSQFQTVLTYCDKELSTKDSLLKWSATHLKPYALNGIGLVYDTWANTDEAQANYKYAVELLHENKNYSREADVLDNLGLLHAFLADAPQALEYFQKALVIREQARVPKTWGVTLSNIGLAHTLLGKNDEALRHLELALPLSQRAHDKRFEAFTLMRMGMAYVGLTDPRKAIEHYERALAIQQDPEFADRRGQAITLDKLGEALALLGKPELALEKYKNALERWTSVGDGQGQALSLYGIARVERDRHNLANARDRIEEAIQIIEKLRNRVTTRQLQMTYFADKQDMYALAIDIRMQLYELTKSRADLEVALSMSEQARARNLIDMLAEARTDLSKVMSQEDSEKNIRLEQQISQLTQAHLRFLSLGEKKEAEAVERRLTGYIHEQNELLALAGRRRSFNARNQLAQPLTAREIQRLLDDNTILLQYSLDERRSHLWTVTPNDIEHYFLASSSEIEDAIDKLRQELTIYEEQKAGESDDEYIYRLRTAPDAFLASARDLSRMVLGQVWSQLGGKRLVIVADGRLQYIPFEVLPSPESSSGGAETLLLARNEIVYQPSASALGLLRGVPRTSSSKTVAALADPVFNSDDERVQPASPKRGGKAVPQSSKEKLVGSLRDIGDDDITLSRLDYSLKEANAITAIAPRGSWMKAVGFNANRATATSPMLKRFSIVHFATHGIVNDRQPELSGIVLSMINKRGQDQDGYLTLRDIYHLDLPVQLVVVSACRTGIGKQVRGEGLIGLTRGFMHAGARSVVVSLWKVDDEATAEFMTRFYSHMLGKNKLPPATALRKAKSEMQAHANERWRAPFYWAGFVLQGDWK